MAGEHRARLRRHVPPKQALQPVQETRGESREGQAETCNGRRTLGDDSVGFGRTRWIEAPRLSGGWPKPEGPCLKFERARI